MKLNHILEAKYHQTDKVELTHAPRSGAEKKSFDRAVNDLWIEGVMYKGQNVYKIIYESDLDAFLQKELFQELHDAHDIHSLDGQESYLGYVPDKDMFVMGWDLWCEVKNDWHNWQEADDDDYDEEEYYREDVENMIMFKIECAGEGDCGPEEWHKLDIHAGNMYPGGLRALHEQYPSTVDVRLD